MRTFDQIPNFVFLGIETPGPNAHGVEILKPGGSILQQGAHRDQITDIEFTIYNNQQVFFTCSLDCSVKAWTVAPDQQSLVPAAEMALSSKAYCMQMATATFLLIGLDNGSIAGWDLEKNVI